MWGSVVWGMRRPEVWVQKLGGGSLRNEEMRKSRSEEKMLGYSSSSLFPARKREAVTQGGTSERPPDM